MMHAMDEVCVIPYELQRVLQSCRVSLPCVAPAFCDHMVMPHAVLLSGAHALPESSKQCPQGVDALRHAARMVLSS